MFPAQAPADGRGLSRRPRRLLARPADKKTPCREGFGTGGGEGVDGDSSRPLVALAGGLSDGLNSRSVSRQRYQQEARGGVFPTARAIPSIAMPASECFEKVRWNLTGLARFLGHDGLPNLAPERGGRYNLPLVFFALRVTIPSVINRILVLSALCLSTRSGR